MLKMNFGPTAIENLMTILVPGWSRADYLLEYSVNSFFYDFILLRIIVDDKMKKVGIKKDSLVKILNIYSTSSMPQKLVPSLKWLTGSGIFAIYQKGSRVIKNIFIHFKKIL